MQARKPHKALHHFPCAFLSCRFILDFKNITKFLMQWKNKKYCSTIVKNIHLPINDTSQLQNQNHHIKPITKIQRLNKFNNKTKEPPSLSEKSRIIIIIVHYTLVQIITLPLLLNDEKQKMINFSVTTDIDSSHKATNCHLNINSMPHRHDYKGVKRFLLKYNQL